MCLKKKCHGSTMQTADRVREQTMVNYNKDSRYYTYTAEYIVS